MSMRYRGGVLSAAGATATSTAASGVWTVTEAQQNRQNNIWPRSPGAPTIGTATAISGGATVAFTAPSDTGSASITTYTAIASPGGLTGTGSSSPVTVSGLTGGTSYTFAVTATNGAGTGPASAQSNSVTVPTIGQQQYTTPGTYSWLAPGGVTSVSVVTVGGGAGSSNIAFSGNMCNPVFTWVGGGGGALAYRNNITVVPGNSYTVTVGAGGCRNQHGGNSFFCSTSQVQAQGGRNLRALGVTTSGTSLAGVVLAGTGGSGGSVNYTYNSNSSGYPGGGGAGGYAGNGGTGGAGGTGGPGAGSAGTAGAGGGGGGGQGNRQCTVGLAGGGGGVGILGQGTNGAAGSGGSSFGNGGGGGSGGSAGVNGNGTCSGNTPLSGGAFGGGAATNNGKLARGAGGAVRIIWPGTSRSFPNTQTGNL